MSAQRLVAFALAIALLVGTLSVPTSMRAASPPTLSLPIPAGETWKVIQGYNCGTHTSYDENAFDLVNTNGRTRGAPVRAAADGTYWWWGAAGGTVILSHGGGYYTMYSHLGTRVAFAKGQAVKRGTVIGTVGSAGTSYSNPHLHFEMFYGEGVSASRRRGVELSFVEGFSFKASGRCNEHFGARLTAPADSGAPRAAAHEAPAPEAPVLVDPGQGQNQIVRWSAKDTGSGIKGYQIYVGTSADGTGEWFVAEPLVALPTLGPGHYYVRVRTLDNVGRASEWQTLFELDV